MGDCDAGETGNRTKEDSTNYRRQQAHLNFAASHQARHAARQHNSNDAGEGEDDVPKEESAVLFNQKFSAETKDISDSLAQLVAESKQQTAAGAGLSGARHAADAAATVDTKEGVREKLDALVDRVKGLRKLTAEATLFLPLYELRRAQEEVGKLLANVESTRAELAPRKKFAFRGKLASRGGRGRERAPVATSPDGESQDGRTPGGEREEDGPGLRGMSGVEVEVKAEDVHRDKDFNLADLDKCTVKILHVLGALRIRRLKSCRVFCGPVRGPIYVEGCSDCVVVAAGRQLRIHGSRSVDFYVLVASGPIIEDCAGLRFAPWGLTYEGLHDQLQEAELLGVNNAWEEVKDFKWHRAQRSPNWGVVPEAERDGVIMSSVTVATSTR